MASSIAAWFPNTLKHNEAWQQAKVMLGQNADIRAIARAAQEIVRRSQMPAEDEMEQARR
jgi:hypothetical protein